MLASDGPVSPAVGGTDILTTDSSYPLAVNFPTDLTTPEYVGRGFAPENARYLQTSAVSGDSVDGIGELDAFTATVTVPEPSSLALSGTAALTGLGLGLARACGKAARTPPRLSPS